jgi:hypothetical protein
MVVLLLAACNAPGDRNGADSTADSTASESPTSSTLNVEGVAVRTELSGEPALGEAEILVYVLDGTDAVEGADVTVTGDMTHAGMVPVVAEAPQQEPGLYATEGFEFTMAGDWIITTEVTMPDGTRYEDELAVSVPGQ